MSTIFVKGNALGTFVCLRFSLTREVCDIFIVAKNRANAPIISQVCVRFQQV